MVTLLFFAAAAVFLSVLSVYGVLSQRVRERSREIGIRVAMGADTTRVLGWVAGRGLRLIALGLAIGIFAAWALAGALEGLLFGVAATDGLTTLAVMAALSVVGEPPRSCRHGAPRGSIRCRSSGAARRYCSGLRVSKSMRLSGVSMCATSSSKRRCSSRTNFARSG